MDVESNAIIQDVKLLEELLLDWKIWNKAEACTFFFMVNTCREFTLLMIFECTVYTLLYSRSLELFHLS